jgi:hypothetical protein
MQISKKNKIFFFFKKNLLRTGRSLHVFDDANMTRKNCHRRNNRPRPFDFDKDSSAFTSSPFDFVATDFRNIQFSFPLTFPLCMNIFVKYFRVYEHKCLFEYQVRVILSFLTLFSCLSSPSSATSSLQRLERNSTIVLLLKRPACWRIYKSK